MIPLMDRVGEFLSINVGSGNLAVGGDVTVSMGKVQRQRADFVWLSVKKKVLHFPKMIVLQDFKCR